jgi:hypothetical protein
LTGSIPGGEGGSSSGPGGSQSGESGSEGSTGKSSGSGDGDGSGSGSGSGSNSSGSGSGSGSGNSGYTGSGAGDISGGISDSPVGLDLTPVFTFSSSEVGPIYFRYKSYDAFDGSEWNDNSSSYITSANASSLSYNPLNLYSVKASQVGTMYSGSITYLVNLSNTLHPEYEIPLSSPFKVGSDEYDSTAVSPNDTNSFYFCRNSLDPTQVKAASSNASAIALESSYSSYAEANYLEVPASTKNQLISLGEAKGLASSNSNIIEDVERFVYNAADYNLQFPSIPNGVDKTIYFLTQSKEGICQHFASAVTLMLRSFGIPARYTTGFLGTGSGNLSTVTTVTGAQAHAWCEAYVEGSGWRIIDATAPTSKSLKVVEQATSKEYDGSAITPEFTYDGTLSEGDTATGKIPTNYLPLLKSDVGKYLIPFKGKIKDRFDNDVTDQYSFSAKTTIAPLTITARTICIETGSTSQSGATSLYNHNYTLFKGTKIGESESSALATGDYVSSIAFANTQYGVGKCENTISSIVIKNAAGKDVTKNYAITYVNGTLEIT